MTRRNHPASIAYSIGLTAAMLALWLRLLVPMGWMPVATSNGVMFTLCSGNGAQVISVGKDGTPAPHDGATLQGACAFSGVGPPALPDVPPAVAIAVFAVFMALGLAATADLRLPAISWLRPPLRGPPARA